MGLAEAYTRVGVTEYRLGDVVAAQANFRKAYNIRRALSEELKDNPNVKQDLSYSSIALAETSYRLGDKGPGRAHVLPRSHPNSVPHACSS